MKYYRDGQEARRIRTFTRDKILEVLTEALADAGKTIGEGDAEIPLYVSGKAAETRYKSGEPFVYLSQRPPRRERVNVLGHDDGKAHSGRKLSWTFILQVSAGKQGSEITDEQTKEQDDALMDEIRHLFEERYAYFRDELKFMDMSITPTANGNEGGNVLNPLTLTFYSFIRMATDEFGYTAPA